MNKQSKKKSFFSLLCISFVIIGCNVNFYRTVNMYGGNEYLNLKKNSTYEYTWYRQYGVGKVDDTVQHVGKWKNIFDTILINSSNTPNNYEYIKIIEDVNESSDSIAFIITTSDTSKFPLPLSAFAPRRIVINGTYFELENLKKDTITLIIPFQKIDYFIIQGYPVYTIKNSYANHIKIEIKDLPIDTLLKYSVNTYFYNEKFLMRNDTLYRLRNNQIEDHRFLIKSKIRGLK